MKRLYLVVIVALAWSTSAAFAQDSGRLSFGDFDANGDGKISNEEFVGTVEKAGVKTEKAEKRFSRIDADGDGFISEDEMVEAEERRQKRKAEKSD